MVFSTNDDINSVSISCTPLQAVLLWLNSEWKRPKQAYNDAPTLKDLLASRSTLNNPREPTMVLSFHIVIFSVFVIFATAVIFSKLQRKPNGGINSAISPYTHIPRSSQIACKIIEFGNKNDGFEFVKKCAEPVLSKHTVTNGQLFSKLIPLKHDKMTELLMLLLNWNCNMVIIIIKY